MKCASAGEKQKKTARMLHTLSRTLLKKGLAGSREDASGIDYENKPMCTRLLKLAEKWSGLFALVRIYLLCPLRRTDGKLAQSTTMIAILAG